jgi:hypothetical protein
MTMAKSIKVKVMVPIEVEFFVGDEGVPTSFYNPSAMKHVMVARKEMSEALNQDYFLGTIGNFNIYQKPY